MSYKRTNRKMFVKICVQCSMGLYGPPEKMFPLEKQSSLQNLS